jgi:hypothetical protein
MRTVVVALTTIALLTAPAYSQGRGKGGGKRSGSDQQSEEQKKKNAESDKAYKAAIDKIPDKADKGHDDPWQKVR